MSNTLWRAFCINDFLTLRVQATIHPDGSMSFPACDAKVDVSASHRQLNIFEHVTRTEHQDEIEAERSSLVYRRYCLFFMLLKQNPWRKYWHDW